MKVTDTTTVGEFTTALLAPDGPTEPGDDLRETLERLFGEDFTVWVVTTTRTREDRWSEPEDIDTDAGIFWTRARADAVAERLRTKTYANGELVYDAVEVSSQQVGRNYAD